MNLDIYCGALAGALLVAFGVWIGAHLQPRTLDRDARPRRSPSEPRGSNRFVVPGIPVVSPANEALRRDVILALTTSGFGRADALAAVDACKRTERSTIEAWTRAAFRQLKPKAEVTS